MGLGYTALAVEAATMRVRVQLYSDLKKYARGRGDPIVCTLAEGGTVEELLVELGVPPGEEMIVGINGELGSRQATLADGDEVMLLTPMQGGIV